MGEVGGEGGEFGGGWVEVVFVGILVLLTE